MNRRNFFSMLVGAVAAVAGVKAAPKQAGAHDYRGVIRFKTPPVLQFPEPVSAMRVIDHQVYIVSGGNMYVLREGGAADAERISVKNIWG